MNRLSWILLACVSCVNQPALQGPQGLTWRPCAGERPDARCATITVPRDYANAGGEQWKLAVAMLPATGTREGVLFTNPGGPGVGAVHDLLASGSDFENLRKRFDIVTFDPRGVGGSMPAIRCFDDVLEQKIRNQPSSPSTLAEQETQLELARTIVSRCTEKFGDALAHVGTRDVARDIDRLRALLGAERIDYLGFSYGTYLGATYAEMFPKRLRRAVLDSVMNPANDYTVVRHDQALALEGSIRRFVTDCQVRTGCPLPGDVEAGVTKLEELVRSLDQKAYVSADGRVLSGLRMQNLFDSSMYTPETGWPALRSTLAAATAGKWDEVVRDAYGKGQMVNPADSAYLSVLCHDLPTSTSPSDIATLAERWSIEAPRTGANRAWSVLPCATWKVRSAAPATAKHLEGSILVLGVTGDPATPIGWARDLAKTTPNGRMLEWQGDGHIAYGRGGACIDNAVETFLFEGKFPAVSVCPRATVAVSP